MNQEVKSTDNHGGHPTPSTYVKVALTLTFITAVEVGVFYLEWLSYGIIPILVILSGAKFAIVVMFYMHLKFDSPLFTYMISQTRRTSCLRLGDISKCGICLDLYCFGRVTP